MRMKNNSARDKTETLVKTTSFRKAWSVLKGYLYIPIVVLTSMFVCMFLIALGTVPTGSMKPNYPAGSFFIANRLVDKDNLNRGDCIVFRHNSGTIYLKRVIGLPGETVSFAGGHVYIDGKMLDESEYLADDVMTYSKGNAVFEVPVDCYFYLGDNRIQSYDARAWPEPFVPSDAVIGRIIWSVYVPFLDSNPSK